MGPLSGYRVIELAGIGPGPYAGQLLADMGAEVICVQRPNAGLIPGLDLKTLDQRGKKSITLDLRADGAADVILKLVKTAHILIEGNRPGVTERLGVGPADCFKVNPKLIYGRMTGWGQTGPWANMAGHDLNYLSITGALNAMGEKDRPPAPPLNLVGDYGGGSLFLITGILAALLKAEKTGQGDIVDAAIIDGVSSMMGIVHSLSASKLWSTRRQANLLDGGVPFYRCYATLDDKFMAVGCIEPQFFALMLEKLDISPEDFGAQHDPNAWPSQHTKLEAVFASKSRDEWAAIFDGSDACVTPVLNFKEAVDHPQNKARDLTRKDGLTHPPAAPAFTHSPSEPSADIPNKGADTRAVLSDIGLSAADIDKLIADKVVHG